MRGRIFFCIGLLVLLMLFVSGYSLAQKTVSISIGANIPEVLELSSWTRWSEPEYGPYDGGHSGDATNIEFGTLEWDDEYGIWVAPKYYTVFLVARTSGRAYQMTQKCDEGLKSGENDLNDSFIVTPDYKEEDEFQWGVNEGNAQGPMPAGDSLGTAGLAKDSIALYDSDSGQSKIVRGYYGLATGEEGTPGDPVTGDFQAGDYTGTVTLTLVLK